MKYLLVALSFTLVAVYILHTIPQPVSAQSSCATILNLQASNADNIEIQKPFQCLVTTDQANSPNIACGVRVGSPTSWPQNFCPSDTGFGGWNGNTATFNCTIPSGSNINSTTSLELVAYDFRSECGPQTGKTLTIRLHNSSGGPSTNPQPTVGPGTPQPTSQTPQPTSSTGGEVDLNKCVGYDVYGLRDRMNKVTNSDLGDQMLNKFKEVCRAHGQPQVTGGASPGPTGAYPTSSPGSGDLYDWNELLNPSSQPSADALNVATKCMQNKSAYESACQAVGFSNNLCLAIMAGIDYREDGCRPEGSCKDGITTIGKPDPSFGINCSATETKPGSPVKVTGGCGFTDKAHAMRWCANHLVGKSQALNGKKYPENLQEATKAVVAYNGIPGNTNCRSGIPYAFCPPKFYLADNLYAFNKYMCPQHQEYCAMNLIYCADRTLCQQPHPFSGLGVFTAGQAFMWSLMH